MCEQAADWAAGPQQSTLGMGPAQTVLINKFTLSPLNSELPINVHIWETILPSVLAFALSSREDTHRPHVPERARHCPVRIDIGMGGRAVGHDPFPCPESSSH